MMFCARRMTLAMTLIYMQEFFWAQVALQILFAQVTLFIVQWYRPLSTPYMTRIETVNEMVTIVLLTMLLCFSDFVEDPLLRRNLGFVYIAIVSIFGFAHLVMLLVKFSHRVRLIVLLLHRRHCIKRPRAP